MSKGLRLTEKWMQRALWLVAFAFAAFLIGLGGKIVGNLWDVEQPLTLEQFMDPARVAELRAGQASARARREAAQLDLEQATQQHEVARANTRSARETFDNWLATRRATARPDQDPELIERTRGLDKLEADERSALSLVQAQQQRMLDAEQALQRAQASWERMETPARAAYAKAETAKELRVFLYRLAVTLPLLVLAGWLFARKRQSQYWPFVWGFIFFALFAFFFELVPYLPSYGGYVRYLVGIAVTVLVGRYAIQALQHYLARQREAEALPDVQRRQTLRYDNALARLGKGVCPGCERPVDLKDTSVDFCPHCGIGLFDRCGRCSSRKNAFARFCFSCGTPANTSLAD
ncbi:zinc ribbon domain-containing protein [Massilia sp. IC2-477]|uniref:zinc ribbon domain-containing protein n=1 Tax=Massilia sp. IC2-477 TaxID=2887198 RepID=UPI001D12058E|nr:zinc ribbon domain-containing protein [Massilia sp. IC2-477]MCC2954469.1 zinc ribbon domain-containing protein [Massilia sp. IC2-477]